MKILHRFCSDEVMVMLERMDTFPDEFIDTSKWDDFLPSGMYNRRFSLAERIVIDKRYEKLKKEYHPRRAREAIIKTLMPEELKETKRPNKILTTAAMTNEALRVLNEELTRTRYANILEEK